MNSVFTQAKNPFGYNRALRFCLLLILFYFAEATFAHNNHPLGKQLLDWRPDPAITRIMSLNFNAHAGHFIIAFRPPGGVKSIDGKECLQGPYFLFDVDDSVIFDSDATVTLEFVFDRNKTSGFYLSYDQVVLPVTRRIDFDPASKQRWYRASVKLDRARFANRMYEANDFSIAALQATHPHSASDDATVTLCDLKLKIESEQKASALRGGLKLKVVNELGQPDTVRAGIYDIEGRAPLAGDSALTVHRYVEKTKQLSLLKSNVSWPGKGRFIFYIDNQYETSLVPGDYEIVISKGPEYRIHKQQFRIEADKTTRLNIELERWIDMPASGWYSGDGHIHISRPDRSENAMILSFTRAEDIHVANLLQMANVARSHFPQYAFGRAGQFSSGKHFLVPGQESPRTSHLGHTIGLNGQDFHWPGEDYFLYHKTADRIHADGGLFGYAHVALADVFKLDRGLALDVPLGQVDFLEVLQGGMLNTKHLYNFLNLGYKLLPSAGSDYPYIHLAGTERTYVKVAGDFSAQAWFDAWPDARSFVSNGPILTFEVNNDKESMQFDIHQGDSVQINASARVNPDIDEIKAIELIVQGEVVATSSKKGKNGIELQHKLQAKTSTWFVLRSMGKNGTVAHTAPVYVLVDGEARFWKRDAVEEISGNYIKALELLRKSRPEMYDDFELFNTEKLILRKWDIAKPALDQKISEAIKTYQMLIKRSNY